MNPDPSTHAIQAWLFKSIIKLPKSMQWKYYFFGVHSQLTLKYNVAYF